jgi:hypothetical protein
MANHLSIDIEFQNIDFDKYYIECGAVEKVHTCHVYISEEEIEIRIFYDHKSYFGEKLSCWAQTISWDNFGKYVRTSNETMNDRVQKFDLTEAKLLEIQNSSANYEGQIKFVVLKIDIIKVYWNPVKEETFSGEFYLNDIGFKVVQPFYSHLFGINEKFDLGRMEGCSSFYKLDKSEFRPEFHAYSKDKRSNRVAEVIKEPLIKFHYQNGISEFDAIHYGEVVKIVSSFYFHSDIEYSFIRIHLPEHTITIKKICTSNQLDKRGTFWGFDNYWDFPKFLSSSWQKKTLQNVGLLSKAIKLFKQALLVDETTEYLIRYNIIEVCCKINGEKEKFTKVLKGKRMDERYEVALNCLLETIHPAEHNIFRKKWESIIGILGYMPMKNPLITFLESQNLDPITFPINFKCLQDLRNNITHGSVNNINKEELGKANILLYRINGILILNLMGIQEWKLKNEIT